MVSQQGFSNAFYLITMTNNIKVMKQVRARLRNFIGEQYNKAHERYLKLDRAIRNFRQRLNLPYLENHMDPLCIEY